MPISLVRADKDGGVIVKVRPLIISFFFTVAFVGYAIIAALRRKMLEGIAYAAMPTTPAKARTVLKITRGHDFPFWFGSGVEAAMLRAVAVPRFAGLAIASEGAKSDRASSVTAEQERDDAHAAVKTRTTTTTTTRVAMTTKDLARLVDTVELLVAELLEHDLDSERGRITLGRIARLRAVGGLSNDECLFLLCLFATEPLAWCASGGFRRVHPYERQAMHTLWSHVGVSIGLERIPPTFESMQKFAATYQAAHSKPSPEGAKLAKAFISLVGGRAKPLLARVLLRPGLASNLTEPVRAALSISPPSMPAAVVVALTKAIAAFVLQYFVPPRKEPLLRTTAEPNKDGLYDPAVPGYSSAFNGGYKIEHLGPSSMAADHELGKLHEKTDKSFAPEEPQEEPQEEPKPAAVKE